MKLIHSIFILLFCYNIAHANGRLLNYELLESFTKDDLEKEWKSGDIPKLFAPINNGVDVYEIIYETNWHDGALIKASGLYFVPKDIEKPVSLLSYQHGTDTKRARPVGGKKEHIIALIFAADGYAVSMPDYVGLGKGDGIHLYQHAETEATACIDMLRAVRHTNSQINLSVSEKLFLSGYSQGGHATVAMHKMIEEQFPDEFQVTASSPMSGPYDLYKTQDPVMFRKNRYSFFLPYLIMSYQEVYNFYEGPVSDIFKAPYDTIVPYLFNGDLFEYEVNRHLDPVPINIIRDTFVNEYKNNPEFSFTKLLQENSNYDWKPEAPIQFCYCEDDEIVLSGNSKLAYKTMKEKGAKVYLRNAGKKFDHVKCAGIAMVYSKMWLDSFRKGSKKGRKGPILKRWILAMAKMFVDKKM